jgi:uncharacterized protein (DUF885 family)
MSSTRTRLYLAAALIVALARTPALTAQNVIARSTRYEDLVTLFQQWREFQKPRLVDGVPDYTRNAMALQQRELPGWQRRLADIDPTSWSVSQQVDYQLVRAEMNGLDFDHRVIRPWEKNPAFYTYVFPSQSDQPAREGHYALGGLEVWTYRFPLDAASAVEVSKKLRAVPVLLDQARTNLTGNGRDLWVRGVDAFKAQSATLAALEQRAAGNAQVVADARAAREATDRFAAWVGQQAANKTGQSGIGVDNYNWYLKNVTLVPYTWEEQVALFRRELARSWTALKLEEHRNRNLPPLEVVGSQEEHTRKFNAAVSDYMKFLRDNLVLTVKDYMEPAMRARIGRYNERRPLEFFSQVDYRDPMIMRTHGFHWFDLARMEHEPHPSPIRRGPLLYNIFTGRTEGLATAWEEMMLLAGMFDTRPRTRELINILVAQRAARGLGDLMMHANRSTLDEAAKFASMWTPRNWLSESGTTLWHEQHLYLQQPTYGTSYIIGKIELENLMAERARQLGEDFTLRRFMDELTATGLIPVSLIRWELTGHNEGPWK